MESVLLWIGIVIGGLIGVCVLVMFVVDRYQRLFIPSRYDWLPLLNRSEWKTPLQLRMEMKAKIGIQGAVLIYTDLEALEEEGFIESREFEEKTLNEEVLPRYEYRLTNSGQRKKLESHGRKWQPLAPRTV